MTFPNEVQYQEKYTTSPDGDPVQDGYLYFTAANGEVTPDHAAVLDDPDRTGCDAPSNPDGSFRKGKLICEDCDTLADESGEWW